MVAKADLILNISREEFYVGHSIARYCVITYGREYGISQAEYWHGEQAIETPVGRFLITIFRTDQDFMCQRTCFDIPYQIGLGDEVFTLGRIAISCQSNGATLRGRCAIGIDVEVNFVIVAV